MRVKDVETTGGGAEAPAPDAFGRPDPPVLTLILWPNRSLSRRGFAWVMGIVAAGLADRYQYLGALVQPQAQVVTVAL